MNAPAPGPSIFVSTHGSGDDGLICGYRFDEAGTPTAVARAADVLDDAPERPGFAWLHFNLANNGAKPWLRRSGLVGVDDLSAQVEGSRSSRIEQDRATLCAVLNDITFDFDFDASNMATLWVFASQRLVISARLHPLRSVDRLRHAIKSGECIESTVALLDHLVRDQADELQRMVRTVTQRIDDLEDGLLAGVGPDDPGDLSRLRRLLVRLHRLLTPEPTALARLLSSPLSWMRADDVARLNRSSEEFALVMRDIASLQERARFVQDELDALAARDNARVLFVLTALTALALPVNMVAGLFGMNVGGVPLAQHPLGFWLVAVSLVVTTALLSWIAYRRYRRRRRRRGR
jgi:zinc transporter